ncbi:hypothetical protein H072_10156 [Dactylellina haptotyla CBS 200.50]|uniref:Killer toxin Kp4 domain-containing protein n=1 Tax=Dactylellina haptotyla (strain CBS 200.50) TaxID=1284197 RepID=S8A0X9_DACHA|nr:hypothetical protein H072_10156 [Dactylellina haptotyla CBS 200.50]
MKLQYTSILLSLLLSSAFSNPLPEPSTTDHILHEATHPHSEPTALHPPSPLSVSPLYYWPHTQGNILGDPYPDTTSTVYITVEVAPTPAAGDDALHKRQYLPDQPVHFHPLNAAAQAPASTIQVPAASESDQTDLSSHKHTHFNPNVMSPPHVPREDTSPNPNINQLLTRSHKKPLGINCRGKHYCTLDPFNNKHLSSSLLHILESVPDDRIFAHKELIACVRGIKFLDFREGYLCAWFDYASNKDRGYWEHRSEMVSGRHAKVLAKEIVMHNCNRCGSVPINYPSDNDGSTGYLTFNARRTGCPGELFDVDSVCGGANVDHGVLVGGEVDRTANGTDDGDGKINDVTNVPSGSDDITLLKGTTEHPEQPSIKNDYEQQSSDWIDPARVEPQPQVN